MKLPRYPIYKESGVEWLGEVPEHWKVCSIKWLAPVRRGASPRPIDDAKYFDDDGEYAWVRISDVSASQGVLRETTQRLSELGSSLSVKINPGELFISIAGTVGSPCITAIKACIHDGFVYFPSLTIEPSFFYRIFEAGVCYGGLGKWGTQLNLNTDTIGSIRVPLPPVDELQGVLAFLGRETKKIDALVEEQRRLIELLKEKRQAVISHAVTKGLSPDAPMKDSGIEWLGRVPAHWQLKATKRLFRLVVEPAPDDNDYELLSIYTEIGVRPRKDLEAKGNKATTTDGYWLVQKGDLIVNKLLAWMGAIGVSDYDGVTSPAYDILRQRIPLEPRFYDYLFRCGICFTEFRRYSRGIMDMRLRLYFDEFGQFLMPYPPEEEQRQIVGFLQGELARFDELIAEATRAIDLLQDRRTALISAAVAGRIDVRGLATEDAA